MACIKSMAHVSCFQSQLRSLYDLWFSWSQRFSAETIQGQEEFKDIPRVYLKREGECPTCTLYSTCMSS